ncbi:MAG: DUF5011 domain-containing protein [Firmicutes bacterium]|nr:DUF5011 domain-containing protein [Bacillota bacterium]
MKAFLKSERGIACIVVAAALLCTAVIGAIARYDSLPKFQDVTIELGTDTVSITDFLTARGNAAKARFVTDVASVDIGCAGDYAITLAQGSREETVTLHVVDTVAPEVEFIDTLVKTVGYVPDAADFVASVEDYAETVAYFAEEVGEIRKFNDRELTVVVEDASGNRVQQTCLLCYTWLAESVTLELGDTLTKEDVLLVPGKGERLVDQRLIDEINASGVGEYTLVSSSGGKKESCTVTVADTTPPELEVQDVYVYAKDLGSVTLEDFVVSASDISGEVELRIVGEIPEGGGTVTIEAVDSSGNVTTAQALLSEKKDDTPPTFSGLSTITLSKSSSSADYLSGVTATDTVDGSCAISYDDSAVKYGVMGTYYVTYTAKDSSGNVATAQRKVVISHDSEDTQALVASIAATLSDDPEEIRDYVRSTISYSHSYGGDDPVWYGFTNKSGNCYVHALCMKAIFDLKGIESQLIWTTDKTHYWLIVKIDGGWKHIDATPGVRHTKYSLMSDAQRLETLQGRTWDHSAWPSCE